MSGLHARTGDIMTDILQTIAIVGLFVLHLLDYYFPGGNS